MPVEELLADRYNKFRKIGLYEEYKVPGGQWREVRAARDKVRAVHRPYIFCVSYALHFVSWQWKRKRREVTNKTCHATKDTMIWLRIYQSGVSLQTQVLLVLSMSS